MGFVIHWHESAMVLHVFPIPTLQYSYLEYPMDREDWRATVHGVTKSHEWVILIQFLLSLPPTSHPIPPLLMIFTSWNTEVSFSQKLLFHFPPSYLSFFFFHFISFGKLTFFHPGISLVHYSSFVTDCFWVLPLKENYKSCRRHMWWIWHSVTPIRLPVFWE